MTLIHRTCMLTPIIIISSSSISSMGQCDLAVVVPVEEAVIDMTPRYNLVVVSAVVVVVVDW